MFLSCLIKEIDNLYMWDVCNEQWAFWILLFSLVIFTCALSSKFTYQVSTLTHLHMFVIKDIWVDTDYAYLSLVICHCTCIDKGLLLCINYMMLEILYLICYILRAYICHELNRLIRGHVPPFCYLILSRYVSQFHDVTIKLSGWLPHDFL